MPSKTSARNTSMSEMEPPVRVDPNKTDSLIEPGTVTFILGSSPNVEARVSMAGHIFVRPLIDGRDVGWFLLDTGQFYARINEQHVTCIGNQHF